MYICVSVCGLMDKYLKKLERGYYLNPQVLELQTFVKLPDKATGN